ncbi:hypothetical protein GEMRC1_005446 [Eukaryota sp. GEM-RC1]
MFTKLSIFLLVLVVTLAYEDGQVVPFYYNVVGPVHSPSQRYSFYSLPYCRPDKLQTKLMSLGELLQGDRFVSTPLQFKFKTNIPTRAMCSESHVVSPKGIKKFTKAVLNEFWFEMLLDDLPLWGPVGYFNNGNGIAYLFNHYHFFAYYNGHHLVGINVTVYEDKSFPLYPTEEPVAIPFTYETTWVPTSLSYDDRFSVYGTLASRSSLHPLVLYPQLYWYRYPWSGGNDVTRYKKSSEALPTTLTLDDFDNVGWKQVSADVFRPPKKLSFLIASVALGVQLAATLGLLLFFQVFFSSTVAPYGGHSISLLISLFVLSSVIGGSTSGWFYKRLGGKDFAFNLVVLSLLYSLPALLTILILSFISNVTQNTHALPLGSILYLLILFVFISFPLSVASGLVARRFSKQVEPPVKVSLFPADIPVQPWFRSRMAFAALAGFLPFQQSF